LTLLDEEVADGLWDGVLHSSQHDLEVGIDSLPHLIDKNVATSLLRDVWLLWLPKLVLSSATWLTRLTWQLLDDGDRLLWNDVGPIVFVVLIIGEQVILF
jgi:hypothetical protein